MNTALMYLKRKKNVVIGDCQAKRKRRKKNEGGTELFSHTFTNIFSIGYPKI